MSKNMIKPKDKPSPTQRFIIESLGRIVWTRYAFARTCGWIPGSIYGKLVRPILHTGIETMLAVLGAELTICGVTKRYTMGRFGKVSLVEVAGKQKHEEKT